MRRVLWLAFAALLAGAGLYASSGGAGPSAPPPAEIAGQPLEREFVEELRWWTLGELQLTGEQVYPEGLAELLADVMAGRYAAEPLLIRTLDGPVKPIPHPP